MSRRSANRITSEETLLYDRITKNQTKIHLKLAQLKKEKPNCCCRHFEELKDQCEHYDPHTNYYEKFWKLFLMNELCFAKVQSTNEQLNSLEEKITEVESLFEQHEEYMGGRAIKRSRRQTFELEKNYSCPYTNCYKSYGTEVSLNLHIKLKHNGGNKSQRDRAAQMIWHARDNGLPEPAFYINLPPGFVEEYRRNRSSVGSYRQIYEQIDSS